MLPAEITNTAAKPRTIFARNLRVGNIVRFDGDAIRADIPYPQYCISVAVRRRPATYQDGQN